jgi:hypothetical protein
MHTPEPPPPPRETQRTLTVMLERAQRQHGRWPFVEWRVTGVLPEPAASSAAPLRRLVHDGGAVRLYQWSGLPLRLIPDASEDYWYNLDSAQPLLFVICHQGEDGDPAPVRITVDQDEAVAAQEVQETVLESPLPPALIDWVSEYVLVHYRPGPRKGERRKQKRGTLQ